MRTQCTILYTLYVQINYKITPKKLISCVGVLEETQLLSLSYILQQFFSNLMNALPHLNTHETLKICKVSREIKREKNLLTICRKFLKCQVPDGL